MRIHFAGADRHLQCIRFRGNGAIVVIRESTGGVVRQVEIQQVFPVSQLLQIHIAAEIVSLFSVCGIAEKNPELALGDPGFEQAGRFEPALLIPDQERDPAHALRAAAVAPGGHDRDFFRPRIAYQGELIAIG